MLTLPPFLELDRGEIPQGRMDALVHVDVVEKPAQLAQGISVILIVRQVNFLFFDSTHQPFCVAVLPGCAGFGHTDLSTDCLKPLDVNLAAYWMP